MALNIEMSSEALDVMTPEQKSAILNLTSSLTVHRITLQKGGLDLPADYMVFRVDYKNGYTPLYGGISPEGDVST